MPFGEKSTKEFVADYYKLQWERISHHEDQRLRFSSMIAAGSVAGIGLVAKFSADLDFMSLLVACLVLSMANLIAIVFCRKSRQWIKYHQNKAKHLIEELEPGLSEILHVVDKPDSDKDLFRREQLFNYLHWLFIFASIVLVFIKQCDHI